MYTLCQDTSLHIGSWDTWPGYLNVHDSQVSRESCTLRQPGHYLCRPHATCVVTSFLLLIPGNYTTLDIDDLVEVNQVHVLRYVQ